MTDEDKIKFAIRYLKQGLKSKRTPPLYEQLMKELGFENNKATQELAEMKECADSWKERYWILNDVYVKVANEKDEQLTKAKELLREIIDTPVFNQIGGESYENEGYTELVEEAEQFLKEVEK